MPVTRCNWFIARDTMAGAVGAALQSIAPIIEQLAGCERCQVLQSQDNPNEFLVLEVWTSVAAHQAAVAAIPAESLGAVLPLLDGPPRGGYYTSLVG